MDSHAFKPVAGAPATAGGSCLQWQSAVGGTIFIESCQVSIPAGPFVVAALRVAGGRVGLQGRQESGGDVVMRLRWCVEPDSEVKQISWG
jgi:hypothetical protein